MIAAIVLAAGRSTRMGAENKLLARLPGGKTMIAQTVANVTACAADCVIIVTGHQAEEVRAALADAPVRFVHAPDYATGMSASLREGIAALPPNTRATIICLGDMPLVGPQALNVIIAAHCPGKIVIPGFRGARGNPVLWDRRFFPELSALSGDTGGRKILRDHADSVLEVPVETDTVLRDFDTPESRAELAK